MLNDRQNDMVEFIKKNKRESVKRLAKHFFVSEMTIRRDLKELEKLGYVKRYSGGAIYCEEESILPIEARQFICSKEKAHLSVMAKKYLHDSMNVFIDRSSTCMYIVPILAEYKDIKIVTNSVQSLLMAAKYHIPCIIAGGDFYEHDMCTVGSSAEEFLRSINTDIAFFSCMGISDDGIMSDNDEHQTAVRKIVMKNSEKNIFVLLGEKQHKKYLYTLCGIDDADDVIML